MKQVFTLFLFSLLAASPCLSQSSQAIINGKDTTYYNIQDDAEEFRILKEFYESTGGPKWKKNTNWLKGNTSADFKKWYGVTVEHGDVTEIKLDKNNLQGFVPQSLYKLISLTKVSIEKNDVHTQSATPVNSDLLKGQPTFGFIENKGQIIDQERKPNMDVKYMLSLPGNNILLKANGFSYDTYIGETKENPSHRMTDTLLKDKLKYLNKEVIYKHHRVDVEFVDINPAVEIIAQEPYNDFINYYSENGQTTVSHFGKVLYKNIYPGIDMEFIASPGKKKPVEYNFIVHPGANVGMIKLKYIGADKSQLVDDRIELTLDHGKLTENIPNSYLKRSRKNVRVSYSKVLPEETDLIVGFLLKESIDPAETLIIDPIPSISWGTYFGGTSTGPDYIKLDNSSNVYIVGTTSETTGIATSGAHKTTYTAGGDGFMVKFNSFGTRLWGTYYGGSGNDQIRGIEVDQTGNVYVVGGTTSTTGIATSGAHKTTLGGAGDAFLVKFNSAGVRQWGTYYGGSDNDDGWAIALDNLSNIYITGTTHSTSGISTAGAYQISNSGGINDDAFVTKFSSAGALSWGTYFGTLGTEFFEAIRVDLSGSIYLGGYTTSNDLPTAGAHQSTLFGTYDALILKFNTSGQFQWCSYYGGYDIDFIDHLDLDPSGDVVLTGHTDSWNNISTPGAFRESISPSRDAFLVKFSPAGIRKWGTYAGGGAGGYDYKSYVGIDNYGNIHVSGSTFKNGMATPDAYQTAPLSHDAYILKFDSNGLRIWGTYFGGPNSEAVTGMDVDIYGTVYLCGVTGSPTGIATPGAFDETMESNVYVYNDGFIAKFVDLSCNIIEGRGLPEMVLGGIGPKDNKLSWSSEPPVISSIGNSTVQTLHRPTASATDQCGRIAFYVMHDVTSDVANRLHIYAADGTQLTNQTAGSPLLALNDAYTNETQIVQVPGSTDKWYIIYSLWQSPCSGSSAYCPARVVYAKVQYNTFTRVLTILSREVDVASTFRYIHGKAVSSNINGDYSKNYLYLAERASNVPTTRFHRFTIDANGIGLREQTPNTIPAQYWFLTTSNSYLELSADGTILAMSNRNDIAGAEDNIVFDVTRFLDASYTPITIKVPELMVDLIWQGIPTRKSINELATTSPYSTTYSCFSNIHRKMGPLQFSPSGKYLYLTNGGYTGASTQRTYLLQIDLRNPDVNGKYSVKIQVQSGNESASCGGGGGTYSSISQIQSAFDGQIYFTKSNQNKLFVIPDPDCVMPQNLSPSDVDLSTPSTPNITLPGVTAVAYLPEQIDGFSYPVEIMTPILGGFTITKTLAQTISIDITNFSLANQYEVDWGDGNIEMIIANQPSHQFAQVGTYRVTVTTFVDGQCPTAGYQDITVISCWQLEGLDFQAERYLCAMKFSAIAPQNCRNTFSWNFGDGQTSIEKNPMHVYTATGTYSVSLTITFNCSDCQSSKQITKNVSFTVPAPLDVLEPKNIDVISDVRIKVISNTASTFSDSWPLPTEAASLENTNSFWNATSGVWRNNATYAYEVPRSQSTPTINTRLDGTYTMEHFNWDFAQLDAIPNWIRANTMTRYSAYGFEVENKDVLGNYSSALYDYKGQLPVANGVNMKNPEMAFTSFESLLESNGQLSQDNRTTGNWVFSDQWQPQYNNYKINSANKFIAVVEAKRSAITGYTQADVYPLNYYALTSNKLVCTMPHPETNDWCLVVLTNAPNSSNWSGEIRLKNVVAPLVLPVIDNTRAHSGKYSLKITQSQTFKQQFIKLDSGKSYWINGWVSVGNSSPQAPILGNNLGFDVLIKNKSNVLVGTFGFAPSGPVIEGWQQVKGKFDCLNNNTTLELTFKPGDGGTAWYDDLRLHPENGNMKSYVYDVADFRLLAILDEENFASYFYYDREGNLYLTKKETREGIKTLSENISSMKKN
jgi:PKD repeat protein